MAQISTAKTTAVSKIIFGFLEGCGFFFLDFGLADDILADLIQLKLVEQFSTGLNI